MQSNTAAQISTIAAKPILKWAGGKTQMLGELFPKVPSSYGRYIEPFFGGGALFFALQPENAVIADSNPELINMYRQVADHVDNVISYLEKYQNTSEMFYSVRSLDWETLPKAEAAARTIYLNRTCYNGLYRVNKKGQFNVPYGKYKNPKICDTEALHAASQALRKADIVCGDYFLVLEHYAQPGDFIFLDPPYLPISEYSDFKRYTKEQFYEEDHVELAKQVMRLHEKGCHVILTNSNHPLVHELYAPFKIDVIQTKRHISCNGSTRKGEDVIVTVPPKQHFLIKLAPKPLPEQVSAYPPTRFMGSKSKLLSEIWSVASQFQAETVVDLFSGSGIVGYMFKAQGKTVISNDYMSMSATFTKAMVENNNVTLPLNEAKSLLVTHKESDHFVASTAGGGKGDLYCEFNDFTILTEVTMSTSSRQEAMEGEPVRRHVSDAVLKYAKPVYGMFIAVRIDTNTAETFRHGIWYAKGDVKQRLDIVPLTLAQFQKYFIAMFEAEKANPEQLRDLILKCESRRDILEAPAWKQYIDATVSDKVTEITNGDVAQNADEAPLIPAGAIVHHTTFGVGQVVAIEAHFPECSATIELPYLHSLPDDVNFCPDGRNLMHDRFGEGIAYAYVIVFSKVIMRLSYPSAFTDGLMIVD